jgi:ribosomal protein S18 acetylase RimI-like enzyme
MAPAPPRGLAIRLLGAGDEAAMISAFSALEDYYAPDEAGARRFLESPGSRLLVAQLEGRAVGALIGHVLPRGDGDTMFHVYEIAVEEAYRQRGVGAALMAEAEALAHEVDATTMWLVTNRSNAPAMALYTSLGGVPDSDDDVVMRWRYRPPKRERDS